MDLNERIDIIADPVEPVWTRLEIALVTGQILALIVLCVALAASCAEPSQSTYYLLLALGALLFAVGCSVSRRLLRLEYAAERHLKLLSIIAKQLIK